LNTVNTGEKENAYKNNLVRTYVGKTLLVKHGSERIILKLILKKGLAEWTGLV
jgi:hypothetical protein